MSYTLVTGAAGFIGSNLCSKLLKNGEKVIGIDNFLLGTQQNIENIYSLKKDFIFYEHDLSNESANDSLIEKLKNFEEINSIWHLAANSDIRGYEDGFNVDFYNTFLTTVNIGKIIETIGIKKLIFSSSSAIFGTVSKPISENFGPVLPESYYGAMKLASEAYISAIATYFLDNYIIFRFPNVIGSDVTHGVIYDFKKKLEKNPKIMEVLGDGSQKKPYLYIDDLIDGMLYIESKSYKNEIFNLSPIDEGITVKEIAEIAIQTLSPNTVPKYGRTPQGWPGDVVNYSYQTNKMESSGWLPSCSSLEAVKKSFGTSSLEK